MSKTKTNQNADTPVQIQLDGKGKIRSHIRQTWLVETPEDVPELDRN